MVKRILTEPIQIVQLNVNRSPDVMTVMQQEYLRDTDILLYQEPAFSRSTLPQHLFLTPKIPGFKTILPIPIGQLRTPPANCFPRVMAYARERDDMIIVPRYDLCLDHDLMVIEIQQRPHQPILIVNIYNPPAGSAGAHSTGQRLRLLELPDTHPVIIAGDFNLHHPDWEDMTTEPIATARALAEWLQDTSYSLLNVHNYPTFHHHNHIHHSVCDLTAANARAIGRSLVSHWRVDEEARTGSDHVVIRYTIANGRVATDNTVRDRPNWKKANEEEYNKAFRAALDERREMMAGIMRRLRPTTREIDDAAAAIREAHHDAMKKTVPIAKICRHSVLYWDEELSTLHNERMQAKETCRRYRATRGFIPQDVEREYRTADNTFRCRIKRKKRLYFRKVLEDSPPTDIYQFRQWSTGARNYPSEPISRQDGRKAITPEEKCRVFLETHFPAPADLPDEPPDLTTHHTNEIEWMNITRAECLRALMSFTPNTAPGEDGIPNRALIWTWGVAADEYHSLISKCIQTGYHPIEYHRSISPTLQKPGKADYSNPRAWRLVHLLSTMGKWIEKIVATRLLYYAMEHGLIPPNQFGAMPGRSTTDAALCLAHDVYAANNHNLFTSLVTFDITGYFDNVNHNRLLSILRSKGIPLTICKWVQSFVSRRETRIRVDGFTDRARAVRTGCPQGSPVSGVLANYYSAPLLESFRQENARERDETAQNAHAYRRIKETPITAGLFVDDGSLYTASSSPTTNARRLTVAFEKVITWAGQNGLKIDMNKVDYICFTCPRKRKIP